MPVSHITPTNLRNSLLAAGFKIEAMHFASNSSIAPSRSFSQPAKRVTAEILAIKPVDRHTSMLQKHPG
ncbi:MAG: hypothetical protein R3F50_17195 [Gammaproteobacteria bacterium]|jgi:hypothetical protein